MFKNARILVAPLDWGLGHAARCVPIIHGLIENGAVPIIGADNGPLALLTKEFPELEYVRIPGITIKYGKGANQLLSMAKQFPAMLQSVQAERHAFDRIRTQLKLNAVISDQRFGIRSSAIPSIVITHQVFPFTPIAQGALRKVNLRNIAKFDRCWIMDGPEAPGLAGELSHGKNMPKNSHYIGTVSRMNSGVESTSVEHTGPYRIVAVISGPEPQRTMLDKILTEQLQQISGNHLLVRGFPQKTGTEQIENITTVNHLNGTELTRAMQQAQLIVSRSGYTTLMDLNALGRSALIIPTPGQEEQEYLGKLHASTGRFIVQDQNNINLTTAVEQHSRAAKPTPLAHKNLLLSALADLASIL